MDHELVMIYKEKFNQIETPQGVLFVSKGNDAEQNDDYLLIYQDEVFFIRSTEYDCPVSEFLKKLNSVELEAFFNVLDTCVAKFSPEHYPERKTYSAHELSYDVIYNRLSPLRDNEKTMRKQ